MKKNKFCVHIITVVQITVIMDVLVIKSYGVHDRAVDIVREFLIKVVCLENLSRLRKEWDSKVRQVVE
jgi:hypothetical protein